LHGSASNWVFNVVRELMIDAVSEPRVLAFYADEIGQVPDPAARADANVDRKIKGVCRGC
jgi:hypothetical protein